VCEIISLVEIVICRGFGKLTMKILIALTFLIFGLSCFSQSRPIQNQTISIQGKFQRKLSPVQKLKKIRKKLERQNELLVKKQIEMLRYQQELELMKKMKKTFEQNLNTFQ
jgi:hypothetical protein